MKRPSLFQAISVFRSFRFFFFFWKGLSLFASPIGNPSLPVLLEEGFFLPDTAWSTPQIGVSADFLMQKRLSSCQHTKPLAISQGELWGQSQIGTFAWNIKERFHFQMELGSGQFEWQWKQKSGSIRGHSNGGLLWSGDIKLIVFQVKETSFAVDAHAGGWDWMDGFATLNGKALLKKTNSKLRYWQIAGAFTQKIGFFAPYFGFALNRTRFKISDLSTGTGRFHARHVLGPFGGCSFSSGDIVLLNMEWRGWFEEALSVSAQLRF